MGEQLDSALEDPLQCQKQYDGSAVLFIEGARVQFEVIPCGAHEYIRNRNPALSTQESDDYLQYEKVAGIKLLGTDFLSTFVFIDDFQSENTMGFSNVMFYDLRELERRDSSAFFVVIGYELSSDVVRAIFTLLYFKRRIFQFVIF